MAASCSIEAVRNLVQATVVKVSTHFMVVVSETTKIAVAGLVPVKETARVGDAPPMVTVSAVAKAA